METKSDLSSELQQSAKEKKPYQPPQIFQYGDVREITRNVGPKGADDGGGGAAAGPKTGT